MRQTGFPFAWRSLLHGVGALILLTGAAAFAQQPSANVEFSNISPTDPHPITYTWTWPAGQKEAVPDPSHYYTYFYTGAIDPDARVAKDVKIERVPVTLEEWEANRKWIVLKLKYYYQITKSQPLTAMNEMTGDTSAPVLTLQNTPSAPTMQGGITMPGALGSGVTQQPLPIDNNGGAVAGGTANNGYFAQPNGTMPQMNMPQVGAAGVSNAAFDAQAAAEWTFYYDQLVLWQYYCARQILNKESELLDPTGGPPPTDANGNPLQGQLAAAAQMAGMGGGGRGGRGGGNRGGGGMMGMPPAQGAGTTPGAAGQQQGQGGEVSILDMASALQPGEAGRQTLEAIRKRATGGQAGPTTPTPGGMNPALGMNQGTNQGMNQGMNPGMMGGQQGLNPAAQGNAAQPANASMAREIFNPATDFLNPDRALTAYRDKYVEAATKREDELYKAFMSMLSNIEEREVNQEQYDKWIDNKRTDLINYAKEWRKAQDGETFMMNDTLFIVTKEPSDNVPPNAINVLKGERITPQDLINDDGMIKKAKVE